MLRVTRFASLGFSFSDFAVHVHDLPEGIGIDGLLGLGFLRHFNDEVRSQEGRIHVDRIAVRRLYLACGNGAHVAQKEPKEVHEVAKLPKVSDDVVFALQALVQIEAAATKISRARFHVDTL